MSDFQGEAEPEAKWVADDVAGQDAAKMHSGRTSDLYETVSDAGKKSADAIAAHARQRPLTSLLIAFAAGFVFSRILTR